MTSYFRPQTFGDFNKEIKEEELIELYLSDKDWYNGI